MVPATKSIPLHVAMLGAPGSGKGTQAAALCEGLGMDSCAPGDLFRRAVKNATPLGLQAIAYMARGELVPDELVDGLIESFLWDLGDEQGAVFDGFPRTRYQAHFLDDQLAGLGRRLDVAILLDVPDDVTLERLADRPADLTGGVHSHLRTFHRTVPSVLSFYERSGRLAVLDATADPGTVTARMFELLAAVAERGAVPSEYWRGGIVEEPVAPPRPVVAPGGTIDLVLLGGPGSGKGTQATELSAALDVPHISTGDLFRENLREETALGRTAKAYMDRGELVPDEVTEEMVRERLSREDAAKGFVLDGYPRSRSQAVCLDDMLASMERVVAAALQIAVSDDEIVRRLSGRLTCRQCQSSFHLEFKPPKEPGVCDVCGGELYQRDDDKPETIAARLRTFHGNEVRLLDHYRQAGLLVEVDGGGDPADVTDRVLAAARSVAATSG